MTKCFLSRFLTALPGGVFLMLFAIQPVTAQVTTATIYGTVTDETDRVVPGADVTITNEGTGEVKRAVTNEFGQFSVSFLQVGSYQFEVAMPGFQRYVRTGVVLRAAQRANISVRLVVGEISDSITVTGSQALLSANTQEEQTHTAREFAEAPILSRDYTKYLEVGTGIFTNEIGNNEGTIALNGLASTSVSFTVDGVNASASSEISSPAAFQNYNDIKGLNIESIQEAQVVKNTFSAEFGNALSGNINLISKNGTNQFHGSLFENYQAGGWNARSVFSPVKESLVRHQFGGSIGGPIKKDKMFFFASLERPRTISNRTETGFVPTQEFRDEVIAARPEFKPVLDLFPLPTVESDPGTDAGFITFLNSFERSDRFALGRWDWNITDSDRVHVTYNRSRPNQIEPRRIFGLRDRDGLIERVAATYTRTNPTWSAETRFGFNKNQTNRIDSLYTQLNELGLAGLDCDCGFEINGEIFNKGGSDTSFGQQITWVRGRHNLKFGGVFRRVLVRRENEEIPEFRFRRRATLLEDDYRRVRFTFGVQPFEARRIQFGGFFQDDFRLTNKLTLNLGLRYDYWTVPEERDDRIFNRVSPFSKELRPPTSPFNSDNMNLAPRIGFAYAVNNKTVVRAGFGVFVSERPFRGIVGKIIADGPDLPDRVDLGGGAAKEFGITFPMTNSQAEALGVRQGLIALDQINPELPNPTALQWNLNIQRELPYNMVWEIGYVGNHAYNLNLSVVRNDEDRITGDRPFADFAEFDSLEPSESTHYNAFQTSLRRKFADNLSFDINYTWSRTFSFTREGDNLAPPPPQDFAQLFLESGPSDIDVGHVFISNWVYELNFVKDHPFLRHVLSGWQFNGVFRAQTGQPFNILADTDLEGSRPDFVGSDFDSATLETGFSEGLQFLDPNAFDFAPGGDVPIRPGTLGRNVFRRPGFWNFDLGIGKNVPLDQIREGMRLQVRLDLFNAFNKRTFSGLEDEFGDDNFGQFTGALPSRRLQLNARLDF